MVRAAWTVTSGAQSRGSFGSSSASLHRSFGVHAASKAASHSAMVRDVAALPALVAVVLESVSADDACVSSPSAPA